MSAVLLNSPLQGVRILDLTTVVYGPYATRILASLGAEVIKLESLDGDILRHIGPMRNPGMGHLFLHANEGKQSLALNLKTEAGRDIAQALSQTCDVFISNIRPQALARLGLDADTLRALHPRLIHVSCTGYGESGPYAGRPAYDDLIQGASGVGQLMATYLQGEPAYAPVTLADRVSGLHAVYAVTTALFARSQTGQGQTIDVTMFEAVSQLVLGDHMGGATFVPPHGEVGYPRMVSRSRKPYRTQDGYLCALIYNDRQWKDFFTALGTPERAQEPLFLNHTARAANIDRVYAEVERLLATRTTAEWQALFDAADIPNMPAQSLEELVQDPHHWHNGFFREVEHPTEGRLNMMGDATHWRDTPLVPQLAPAPRLGEHSRQVLESLGHSAEVIEAWKAQGVWAGD